VQRVANEGESGVVQELTLVSTVDSEPHAAKSIEAVSQPPSRPELAPGCVLGGRYRIERKVGAGGMGEVWAAQHLTLHMQVAVKALLPAALKAPEIVTRFGREAMLLSSLRSDHVPRAIDFLTDDVYGPVLVTEFVEGEPLSDLLRCPLSVEQTVELGLDLAAGVAELHHGNVVHRDLKPGNVIMRPVADGRTRAVIIDFGVSRLMGDTAKAHNEVSDITTGNIVLGTLEYMAPEQILQCGDATATADLYALGAVLFRAVTGRHVFGGRLDRMELVRTKLTAEAPPLPTERRDPVARGLATVLARALQRDPASRYQSVDEFRVDLRRLRDLASSRSEVVTVAMVPPVPAGAGSHSSAQVSAVRSVARGLRRHPFVTAIAAALLVGAAVCTPIGRTEARVSTDVPPEPPARAGSVPQAAIPQDQDPTAVQASSCDQPGATVLICVTE
jgi:serine/threonine-protein kinase